MSENNNVTQSYETELELLDENTIIENHIQIKTNNFMEDSDEFDNFIDESDENNTIEFDNSIDDMEDFDNSIDDIEDFETIEISDDTHYEIANEEKICLICLENILIRSNVWIVKSKGCNCKIEYHPHCFMYWYNINRSCPICHTILGLEVIFFLQYDINGNFILEENLQNLLPPQNIIQSRRNHSRIQKICFILFIMIIFGLILGMLSFAF
jgi:hypothetical protein